jgi:hypothetical protein
MGIADWLAWLLHEVVDLTRNRLPAVKMNKHLDLRLNFLSGQVPSLCETEGAGTGRL